VRISPLLGFGFVSSRPSGLGFVLTKPPSMTYSVHLPVCSFLQPHHVCGGVEFLNLPPLFAPIPTFYHSSPVFLPPLSGFGSFLLVAFSIAVKPFPLFFFAMRIPAVFPGFFSTCARSVFPPELSGLGALSGVSAVPPLEIRALVDRLYDKFSGTPFLDRMLSVGTLSFSSTTLRPSPRHLLSACPLPLLRSGFS